MGATDVSDPRYYHKVVDCQWACPAHTNVPGYLRLIAQGRYDDSYLLNRQSNVFPGILGRTCDRPCEPACRRGRVDEKPVAICRLKRVAADLRGDIRDRLPKPPAQKNGKRVVCVGAGPSSLTVANDLLPLGYDVTIVERNARAGGLMRINIPAFRLPGSVLDEECGYIIDMGANMRYETTVTSLKALLAEGFDAVYVGSGAPKGKELDLPGRWDAQDQIHLGIDWLANVHFEHLTEIGKRVLIIGVGNTAMDCCRTAKRLGATDVKVVARRGRKHFKASPWELEDAEEEHVQIIENHAPKRFVIEHGKLVGMEFEQLQWSEDASGKQRSTVLDTVIIPCDDVILAIGQDNAFPWIERDIGIEFDARDMPVVDKVTHQSTRPNVFFGGDAAWGPENIIWAVAHGHQAAISIDLHCQGKPVGERPPLGMTLVSAKVGMHAWAYENDYDTAKRARMQHEALEQRFHNIGIEVELGFTPEQAAGEVQRCLNCDVQTHFSAPLCIECDACVDVCPTTCLTITTNSTPIDDLRLRLSAPALNTAQEIYVSAALPQTKRVMVKDEDVCLHCGLCAERCPTAAWDMRTFDLQLPYAGQVSR
ncbi:MAG: FAD-dependent oxidoreductase [Gemmatimonadetes bacterium]|nr:FAD-dependent oxidoreductase [Gemmatimonadota bacterium]MBK9411729.1 FAD-dependent oxidoreductase [Gemmatimonadota bacterium]MBK9976670.1 FAD-dependent oxidoreductase [Gemmatimonadota bacterium]